jgi:metal-responsive CopG/Arc/MetJ family transcriptional regulator
MKTAVSIPDPIFEEADELADALGVSRSQLYARALKRYVARHRHATVTEALNRVYAKESSELDPVVAAIQAASLPREDW